MKFIALFAIRFYQRAISPYKGFRCAYAACSGRASCSALGYRAIRRFGVWHGLAVLDRRLEKCGVAARRNRPPTRAALGQQAGFVDCSCDVGSCDLPSCDLPSCDLPSGVGDACGGASDCLSCDCDWRRRRAKRGDDQYVVIPSRGNVL